MDGSVVTARRVAAGLVLLSGIGLLAGYGLAMRARPATTAIALSPSPSSEGAGGRVFVHVGGAVAAGGLYELREGARVDDAIRAAGGVTAEADVDAVNLAAPVKDGDKVLVPERGDRNAAPGQGGPPQAVGGSGLINLNTASASELEELPGIGPALAQRIIAFRTERGGFRTVEELIEVSGIGPKTFEGLRDMVTV